MKKILCRSWSSLRVALALSVLTLAGCGPEPTMQMQHEQVVQAAAVPAGDQNRVTVERIGVFRDNIAYGDRRAIYIIRDRETGREFIGVSGVGIAETGSHSSGKTRRTDER